MMRYWKILKEILTEIAWLGIAVLFCLGVILAAILLAVLLYALVSGGAIFDGSNPRFGG